MKNLFRTILFAAFVLGVSSCYEDYVQDYEEPNMGFAMEKSIRTVISDRDPVVYVGVSIGGKREVDMNDWARFVIDESLLEGTGKVLLPSEYYVLGDSEYMRVRKDNLPVADVKITLTDAFFADPHSLENYYVLPFRMTENSIGAIRGGGEYTLPVFKYISNYAGTYYRMGTVTELDESGASVGSAIHFGDTWDITTSPVVTFKTNAPHVVVCPGLGKEAESVGSLVLTIEGTSVSADGLAGKASITGFSGTYRKEGEYYFPATMSVKAPQFNLSYTYSSAGKSYKVEEKLVLRQDPQYDLRAESW
ncbi:MAG: DUF1735 domain-containing protein [Bacteroidales bacterium]|nr:DUF1735 domain-containing protein [Bacteroidales bacterium]